MEVLHIDTEFKVDDEIKLSYTYRHCQQVAYYTELLGKKLGFSKERLKEVVDAAFLHDIGKIAIPASILDKPSRLTFDEFEIIKSHPQVGFNLVKKMNLGSETILNVVLHHHERYDGKGYPLGLESTKIPLEAKIVSITDAFDAMVSDRPYRKGLSVKDAVNELIANKRSQFDPMLVDNFITVIEENNNFYKER